MKEQETKKGLLAKLQSGKLLEVLVILILAIIVIVILYNAFYKDKEDVSASGKEITPRSRKRNSFPCSPNSTAWAKCR